MVFDFVHGHVRSIGIAEDDHSKRVAHENQRKARFVEQAGHRKIIGCQGGDFLAARLHTANGVSRDFCGCHPQLSTLSRNAVKGLVALAVSLTEGRPVSNATRPASTAHLNAWAMRRGSLATAIDVLTSTASAPISMASAA